MKVIGLESNLIWSVLVLSKPICFCPRAVNGIIEKKNSVTVRKVMEVMEPPLVTNRWQDR